MKIGEKRFTSSEVIMIVNNAFDELRNTIQKAKDQTGESESMLDLYYKLIEMAIITEITDRLRKGEN